MGWTSNKHSVKITLQQTLCWSRTQTGSPELWSWDLISLEQKHFLSEIDQALWAFSWHLWQPRTDGNRFIQGLGVGKGEMKQVRTGTSVYPVPVLHLPIWLEKTNILLHSFALQLSKALCLWLGSYCLKESIWSKRKYHWNPELSCRKMWRISRKPNRENSSYSKTMYRQAVTCFCQDQKNIAGILGNANFCCLWIPNFGLGKKKLTCVMV